MHKISFQKTKTCNLLRTFSDRNWYCIHLSAVKHANNCLTMKIWNSNNYWHSYLQKYLRSYKWFLNRYNISHVIRNLFILRNSEYHLLKICRCTITFMLWVTKDLIYIILATTIWTKTQKKLFLQKSSVHFSLWRNWIICKWNVMTVCMHVLLKAYNSISFLILNVGITYPR